ncbi:MAG: TrmH family RNA methyltransferase [Calditrichia bacterium]
MINFYQSIMPMKESWRKFLPLQTKRGRLKEGKFIVEGVRLSREALLSPMKIERAFITEEFSRNPLWNEFKEYFNRKKVGYSIINRKNLKKLAGTETPQGILLIAHIPQQNIEKLKFDSYDFILFLQSIRDPGNLGTLIRSADWFNVKLVLLSTDCVDPFNPKVVRSTMGSIFHLPVVEVNNFRKIISRLKKGHFLVIATSLAAKNTLDTLELKKPVALILGGEARGISAEVEALAGISTRIYKYGQAESLNVAVAGGIIMNHIANQIYKHK